jgi:four helix bundle protein
MRRFEALELSLSVIRELREVMPLIRRESEDLARQIHRAASSVSLNIGEANRRTGRDRLYHFRIASGSADEVRCALLTAQAWGCLQAKQIRVCLGLLDQQLAVLWVLAEGRRGRARSP